MVEIRKTADRGRSRTSWLENRRMEALIFDLP